jgi:hypothetical protein
VRYTKLSMALLIGLGGCGLLGGSGNDPQAPACPEVGILREGQRIERYRNDSRDPSDLLLQVEVRSYTGECRFDTRGRQVTVDLALVFAATRGPAAPDRAAVFDYIVAIVDQGGQVIARQEFRSDLVFPPNQSRVGVSEELTQVIPLAGGREAATYQVLVGLAVTRAEAERNLQRR